MSGERFKYSRHVGDHVAEDEAKSVIVEAAEAHSIYFTPTFSISSAMPWPPPMHAEEMP